MKIGIVHFTDIHFSVHTKIDNKLGSCINALKNDFYGTERIYFVLSGDISFSGKKEEFDLAKSFFNKIKQLIEKQYPFTKIKMIIVPGNHDCNMEMDSQIRRHSLENMRYDYLGTDNSVIESCLTVQSDFWEYYSQFNPIPTDKLFYQITDIVNEYKICFNCINTSWISQKNEKVGSLFFPVKRYDSFNNDDCYLNIGVWHHPLNWFNPSTAENNKKEIESFTEKIASVHLLGHEHENDFHLNKNMYTGDKVGLLSGKVFSTDRHPNNSGFQTIVIELDTKIGKLKKYDWKKDYYDSVEAPEINFNKIAHKRFDIKQDFLENLDEMKIPLVIGQRKKIKQSEIFVFPDIELFSSDTKVFDNYNDSEYILENKYGNCLLAGDSQIGKTSLLNMIYLKAYQESKTPIMITGSDIKELDFIKILKRAFRKQYRNGDDNFEAYQQLEKTNKILLIDDYHKCNYNATSVYEMLKEAMDKFQLVVLSIDRTHSMLPILQAEFKDIKFFSIKPLGYRKRNQLVERYLYLRGTQNFIEHDDLTELEETFDKVQGVLGDKLIPPYPVFILSILQSLELNAPRQNETSFGYCYQALIYFSLHKAEVKNDLIDTYFNFLGEIAYEFVKREVEIISETDFINFYTAYKDKFIIQSYDTIRNTLKNSKILTFDKDDIYFGYDYILYYLSARKIAKIINTYEGKRIINNLFQNLHIEKNGNILVFVTHHSQDISFIEESLLHSMIILTDYEPITLATNDPFYNQIKTIADELSDEILEINKNPKEERQKKLKELDKRETKENIAEDNNPDSPSLPIRKSLRSIEIVGQIIRNRKGSLEKAQLKNMISEIYTTGFRTISYMSNLLISTKDKIVLMLNSDDTILESGRTEIKNAVTDFVVTMSFESCLGVFGKITSVMGIKDLKVMFNEVADEINTPAAKLVSFAINSYYGNISETELKTITAYLKGNPVAMSILRGRVKSYVYSRNLDIKTKQKFAKLLDMSVPTSKLNQDY